MIQAGFHYLAFSTYATAMRCNLLAAVVIDKMGGEAELVLETTLQSTQLLIDQKVK